MSVILGGGTLSSDPLASAPVAAVVAGGSSAAASSTTSSGGGGGPESPTRAPGAPLKRDRAHGRITIIDVAKSFRARWNLVTELGRMIPGGIWYARVPPEADAPYATITVKADRTEWTTDTAYMQDYEVGVSVWADGSPGETAMRAIQRLIAEAFDNRQSSMVIRNGKIVRVRRLPGEMSIAPQLRSAKDVSHAAYKWRVTVQGSTARR